MDGNGGMEMKNWPFLEGTMANTTSTLKGSNLGLQLMSSMVEKPIFGRGGVRDHMVSNNGGLFHHQHVGGISEPHLPMECWMNQDRDVKPANVISQIHHHHGYYQLNYGVPPEISSAAHSVHMPQQMNLMRNENLIPQVEELFKIEPDNSIGDESNGSVKKRGGGRSTKSPPKEKKPRTRAPKVPKDESTPPVHRARAPKKRAEVVINGINMDISGIPIPVCSCTGTPQQCYRWGSGGWQSACCTTAFSVYPLPMNAKRRGARIAGRKMSIGAFKKVLEKLASEGYNFSEPIDLKSYWAKHGTNKFVTLR